MRRMLVVLTTLLCAFQAWGTSGPKPGPFQFSRPVEFEINQGQHHDAVRFLARAASYQMGLTETGAIFALAHGDSAARTNVGMRFIGASPVDQPVGVSQTTHKTHYFLGDSAGQQYRDIANFGKVVYRSIYPGVDAVFYGKNGEVEYDFILEPGADPRKIQIEFTGARKIEVDAGGDLLVHTAGGVLRQHKPFVYQLLQGERHEIASHYRVLGENRVGFELAQYDARHPVTVDPVLSYSTYLGGSFGDAGNAIAVDAAGHAYVTGQTYSTNFPVVGAAQGSLSGSADVFVAKLNPQGTGLIYSTYIGGRRSSSEGRAIAVGADGSVYVAGTTSSNSYPVTAGALSSGISGGGAFVTKLSPTGNALVYSTYLRGASPLAIRVDAAGSAYVAGQGGSGFPATVGAFQSVLPPGSTVSGFVAKLNPSGSALSYATYLGGAGDSVINSLAVDSSGSVFVAGTTVADNFPVTTGTYQASRQGGKDAFVSRLDASGSNLLLSSYLGGTSDDNATAIAIDGNGRMYLAGDTYSTDFPLMQGYSKPYDSNAYNVAFVTVLDADAATLAMSTYLGGKACLSAQGGSCYPWDPTDGATAIAVDPTGKNIHVAGYLSSLSVSWIVNPIQAANNGRYDAFVAKIEADPFSQRILNIRYATRLGGGGDERVSGMAVDPAGNAYITGSASTANFPTTQGAHRVAAPGQQDVFVVKISTHSMPIVLVGGCDGTLLSRLVARLPADAEGTVEFRDYGAPIAVVPISGGVAAHSAHAAVGTHKYTAVHSASGAVSTPVYCKVDQ